MVLSSSLYWNLFLSSCLRFFLIVYGLWQDSVMAVKYTDVDYVVFTDAARFMLQGRSPYERSTYRYTPLLTWLLQPNLLLGSAFGKLLFALCDIVAGFLIYRIVLSKSFPHQTALNCCLVWLFNPLTLTVSTRGNAESIIAVLVLLTLYFVIRKPSGFVDLVLAGIFYGISVHMKIYPVTYALAFYLYINCQERKKSTSVSCNGATWINRIMHYFFPSWSSVIFGLVSFSVFSALTGFCYSVYGDEFLQEAYLYHVTRKDIRHNFSPYFYLLYLTSANTDGGTLLSLVTFLPQIVLMIVIAVRYREEIGFACFAQTFVFVTFNKVCTSQYFLWYLCLLPLVLPNISMNMPKAGSLFILWLLGQALWLLPAYFLEFHGYNTFFLIWISGLVFLIINSFVLNRICISFRSSIRDVDISKHKKIS